MKKKVLILIFSILTACLMVGACSGKKDSSDPDSQGPAWEDEIIEDKEHGEIELPEVERD